MQNGNWAMQSERRWCFLYFFFGAAGSGAGDWKQTGGSPSYSRM